MRRFIPIVVFAALVSMVATQAASVTAAAGSPLVGRWERVTTCQQLVAELQKAGLGAAAPYAWLDQTSSLGESSFRPGSPKPTKAHPCAGAIPRLHSHFFSASGKFGSLDWKGGQVDDGLYRIVNSTTLRIGPQPFHFRILHGNTLMLSPVLTKAMIRQAAAHPQKFSPALWAISVAYAGYTWKRVACNQCGLPLAATTATASGPVDIPTGGDIHEGIGQGDTNRLQRSVTYQASAFPLALRVRPPDSRWEGVQYESGRFRFVQFHHLRTGSVPLHGVGYMTLEAAKGSTPSANTAIKRLHATPNLAASPVKPIRVASFVGEQFDATVTGKDVPPYCRSHPCSDGVSLVPFTINRHCGYCTNTMKGETQDVKFAGTGQVFRIIAINVRGKTIVIYLESNFADQPKFPPAKTFPTFLPYAQRMLAALVFPTG
jgi:hypothetical protein